MSIHSQYRWRLWLVALAAWTAMLLAPAWLFGELPQTKLPGEIGLGKLLHACAYAVLAATIWTLPASKRGRCFTLAGLSLHTGLTEYLQNFTGRDGSWRDVGIDHVGIGLGLAVMAFLRNKQAAPKANVTSELAADDV